MSYLYDVPLRQAHNDGNLPVVLYLSSNQFRLGTPAALYSDGLRYPPAIRFLDLIGKELPAVKKALILGTGAGSTVGIINAKGSRPRITLVEMDEDILSWAVEILEPGNKGKLDPVCEDASAFMARNKERYDLIFVDVFVGREVPGFVMSDGFLRQCHAALNPGGFLGLNYIVNDDDDWYRDHETFLSIFPKAELISFDMNRVFVWKHPDH